MTKPSQTPKAANRDIIVAASCGLVVALMVGASYAAVPLYDWFCRTTGFNGTTQVAKSGPNRTLDRKIVVRFDANVGAGLPWTFEPDQRDTTLRIGETVEVRFHARNNSSEAWTGRAAYNVSPHYAGSFFNKLECFCFTDMTLKPGEEIDMPVVFFVDPDIVNQPEFVGLKQLTLSYTFYPSKDDKPVAAAPAGTETTKPKLGG